MSYYVLIIIITSVNDIKLVISVHAKKIKPEETTVKVAALANLVMVECVQRRPGVN